MDAEQTEQSALNNAGELNSPAVPSKHRASEIAVNVALWITIAVLVVAVVLRLFVFNTVEVDGASMNPTYENNEVVVVNKVKKLQRGDVVVFYKNEVSNKFTAQFASREECQAGQPYEKLIKRVVATGGDKIWVQRIANSDTEVFYQVVIDAADGKRYFENYYVKRGENLPMETYYLHSGVGWTDMGVLENCTESEPFVVSDDCFFAMGDNRALSKDSRYFGEFKVSQLFGVVLDK